MESAFILIEIRAIFCSGCCNDAGSSWASARK